MYTQKYWWLALIRGIILIVLAIYVFQYPVGALVGVAVYIGISLLFTGVTQIIVSFMSRGAIENWGWGLAGGIIDIIFATVLLSNPELSAASLPFAFGFWLVFSGAMTFVNSFRSKKEGASNWWLELITGLLTVLIGYMIAGNLLVGAYAVTVWLGIGFLFAGIASIVMSFSFKKGMGTV